MLNSKELLNKVELFLEERDSHGYISDYISFENLKMLIENLEKRENEYQLQQSMLSE